MKKILLSLVIAFLAFNTANAQSMYGDQVKFDVKMKYVYSFEEALSLAKEKNKLIFFNCFADWAVPCHSMNKKVFSNQEFADWMDNKFINFFIDVTKGDGRVLAKKYNIQTMAHYLVLNANGEVVHRIVGGSEIPEFKRLLAQSLNTKTSLAGMNVAYENGNRKINFLRNYFETLKIAEDQDKAKIVLNEAFSKIDKKQWSKKENWNIFSAKMNAVDNEYVKYVIDNKAAFTKSNGVAEVDKVLANLFKNTYLNYMLGSADYDANKFLDYFLLMQKAELPKTDEVFSYYDFAKFRGEHNVQKMIDILNRQKNVWNPNILRVVDLSLDKIKDYSKEEKIIVTAYWQGRADSIQGSTANHYKTAIKKLNAVEGIKFQEISYNEALQKADKENKLIFMDCFTTWCGPCKWLDVNTFLDKKVGEHFNANFINLKIDMEKGEGIQLREKYGVNAFPTLLVLDAKGNVVKKIVGAVDSKEILERVQNSNN